MPITFIPLLKASPSAATAPTLPNPCTTAVHFSGLHLQHVERALDEIHHAAPGRLAPSRSAADRDRFAGDDFRHGVARGTPNRYP